MSYLQTPFAARLCLIRRNTPPQEIHLDPKSWLKCDALSKEVYYQDDHERNAARPSSCCPALRRSLVFLL